MKQYKKEIDDFSNILSKISGWKKSAKPFGHVVGARKDYVYEFWCCVKILQAIHACPNQNVDIRFGRKKFPRATAPKDGGWSYFEIKDDKGNVIHQVCTGTGISRSDAPRSVYHPDISIQSALSSLSPTEKDVEVIMDAKFQSSFDKSDEPGCIPLHEINSFSHLVNVLKTTAADKSKLNFGKLKKLKGNCLLSNANTNGRHAKACEQDSVKQVGNFDRAMNYTVIGK